MFSRYLYGKVRGSKTRFISLYLNPEDVDFLKLHDVPFSQKEGDLYRVDSDKLKSLFCH